MIDIRLQKNTSTCIHIYIHIHTNGYIYTYTYMIMCVYIYIHISIYTYPNHIYMFYPPVHLSNAPTMVVTKEVISQSISKPQFLALDGINHIFFAIKLSICHCFEITIFDVPVYVHGFSRCSDVQGLIVYVHCFL